MLATLCFSADPVIVGVDIQIEPAAGANARPGESDLVIHWKQRLPMRLILLPVAARADIIADAAAPASQQPMVGVTGNGVPVVNIQTPSAAGVSRNTYSEFNVDSNGAVLNNSNANIQTQLGGWVQGNPALANGAARVILNEINATDPSRLKGFVEVAGSQAQVVVANPAGITCDGCGFLNASAGQAVMNNGQLQGYRVGDGRIAVTGAGLQTGNTAYTDLIGRAVQINAGVWANRLQVTTGRGEVAADGSSVTPAGDSASNGTDLNDTNLNDNPAPAVAIDVSALGGMYANSIRLVGTEAGVGVRNAGQIGVAAGEVTLTADGRIENTGTLAGTQLTVSTNRTLDNAGEIAGQHNQVTAVTLNNQGVIDGASNDLASTTVNNAGRITGQNNRVTTTTLENAGAISGDSNQLTASVIRNHTEGQVKGQVNTLTVDTLSNEGAITGGQNTLTTTDLHNTGQLSGERNSLRAQRLSNAGAMTGSDNEIDTTTLDNNGQITGNNNALTTEALNNAGAINGRQNDITSTDLTNVGQITGERNTITTDTLNNSGAIIGNDNQLGARALHNNGNIAGHHRPR